MLTRAELDAIKAKCEGRSYAPLTLDEESQLYADLAALVADVERLTAERDEAVSLLRERPTRTDVRALLPVVKRAVEGELPEDEPDYTADWVYETAIRVTLASVYDRVGHATAGQATGGAGTC